MKLFADLPDAGAIGGLSYKAYLVNGQLRLTDEALFGNESTKDVFFRRPLRELAEYCRYLTVSGLPGAKRCEGPIARSVLLSGMNMGVRSEAIRFRTTEGLPQEQRGLSLRIII